MAFDAIIIGSGFGGAVTACRLAESGRRVLVLERGRRWDKTNYPRQPTDQWLWDERQPEKRPGWLDLRRFSHMTVAQGAAVGGGSQIYANISCEAPPHIFERGWPLELTFRELKPHYDRVKQMMNVQCVPENRWTARMKLMKEAATKLGYGSRFKPLELAVTFDAQWTYENDFEKGVAAAKTGPNAHGAEQGTCVHLGNCDIGCDVHARNTLDLNYLYVAENTHHADVRALHLVTNIEPLQGGGYRVLFDDITGGARNAGSETAPLVIVAAGSLGSTELLLRCKEETRTLPRISGRLGVGWSSNGDFLTPALHPGKAVSPTHGPTIGSAIDFLDGSENGQIFWIEDGGLPNIGANFIRTAASDPGTPFKIKAALEAMQVFLREHEPFREVMPWFAQGVDAANGRLHLTEKLGRRTLDLEWNIQESRKIIDTIVSMHKRLARAAGGLAFVPLTWSLFQDLVTPHPLGGCNIGTTAADGVVDHRGEVFGYKGLYVIDGAIVPEALGVNPSRTIAALAERSAALLVAGLQLHRNAVVIPTTDQDVGGRQTGREHAFGRSR